MVDESLLGIHEISQLAGVTPQAVANWRVRHDDFPDPIADLRAGPVFNRDQVRRWLRRRKVPMATVIATINLKGGVGKTTTTIAVGEILAGDFRKRVLLVDLDPQTNATVMLIGEKRWKDLNDEGRTLAQLFKNALDPESQPFDLESTLQRKASGVGEVRTLSLLPSSIDLIEVQDRLASMPSGRFYAKNPTDILRRAIRPVIDEFDYVLIDCPPSLGIVTLNGLRMSNWYLIPTIADELSTYGIPQIKTTVKDFSETVGEPIEPLGIVITKYRTQSTVHRAQARLLRDNEDVPVFDTVVPESNDLAAAAVERRTVSTLRQRYGYAGQYDAYRAIAEELLQRVGDDAVQARSAV